MHPVIQHELHPPTQVLSRRALARLDVAAALCYVGVNQRGAAGLVVQGVYIACPYTGIRFAPGQ
jgi:hypothetical protein